MLLSFERGSSAGAFVVSIAGAMLLFVIGLEQAVLPESKNMRKRTIGVPQELGISYAQYAPRHNLPWGGGSAYRADA